MVLLIGFDNVVAPIVDGLIQNASGQRRRRARCWTFSNWKLMIFGLALILMMRFRPEGLLPSTQVEAEWSTPSQGAPAAGSAGP